MLMISLGTGWWRMRHDAAEASCASRNLMKARDVAVGMVQDSSLDALVVMQALSEPRKPWTINSEIGDQAGESLTMGESLVFQRFDASLEAADVRRALNLGSIDDVPDFRSSSTGFVSSTTARRRTSRTSTPSASRPVA